MAFLNNRKRDVGGREGEIKETIAPKKYTTVNNPTTIVLKYSAVTFHRSQFFSAGWKQRNVAGKSGGLWLQRSVMFQADFNG